MPHRNLMQGCIIAILLLALTGCGQTGPLYLPEKPASEQPASEQPEPAPAH